MKRPLKIAFALAILLGITLVAGLAFWLAPTYLNQGDQAISLMSESELTILKSLKEISPTDSYADVIARLGPPNREAAGLRPSWKVPKGNGLNQFSIYFTGDHPRKIRWMKMGSFMWEKTL